MAKEIKKRSEIEKQYTWALEDIYKSDDVWREDFENLKQMTDKITNYHGILASSAQNLYDFYQLRDQLILLIDNLASYALRKHDEDTKNSEYQAMAGTISSFLVKVESSLSFELPEILAISDEVLLKFYLDKPELKLYERYFNVIRAKKDHILSEKEEKLLAMALDISKGAQNIYSIFLNADLKFPSIKDSEGKEASITHGTFISYMEQPDRRVRKDAFDSLYSVYKQFQNTAATTLNAQIKQLAFFAKARNYKNTLDAALSDTEVPEAVYHNLIQTVSDNIHQMHRYIKLRKKVLGLDELHFYDIYTPIVKDIDVKIPYEEAKKEVYDALAPLGDEYRGILKEGFEERWIDVYENEGKRSGAYSAGANIHPFVLLNHMDTLDSEFTLAHEMGHALHSYYSNRTQPIVYSDYKIFVAEVASTCNEALLMRYLLNKTKDKKTKAYLINHFLDEFRATLFRQTMFAEFELKINRMVEDGETLTSKALNQIYHDLNVKYYGDDIIVDEYIDLEWARIPHFYLNFYVYQYATGYSAAIALSNKILKEGASAVENYIKFLSSGCIEDPISLLKLAGVDMSTATPIEEALKVFGELIDEMEQLLE